MKNKRFSLENILVSLCGHLFLVAIMLTSFAVVMDRAKLVANDRVQITEIDLSDIKITRDETALRNTKDEMPDARAQVHHPSYPFAKASGHRSIIRVNRESAPLVRTMTASVSDALRIAMTRCWVIDTKHAGISDIRAVAHLTMNRNGAVRDVWFESAARADTDAAFAYVLQTIRTAIGVCAPFKMLPQSEFAEWEKIQLTFYPATGAVQ